jgi:hypothetical protein
LIELKIIFSKLSDLRVGEAKTTNINIVNIPNRCLKNILYFSKFWNLQLNNGAKKLADIITIKINNGEIESSIAMTSVILDSIGSVYIILKEIIIK